MLILHLHVVMILSFNIQEMREGITESMLGTSSASFQHSLGHSPLTPVTTVVSCRSSETGSGLRPTLHSGPELIYAQLAIVVS